VEANGMNYYNNPYGRRRVVAGPQASGPTLADYQAVVKAYQEVQAQAQQQAQELALKQRALAEKEHELGEKNRELAIKSEALQRQNADLKQLEAELVWTKAALQQQDRAVQQETDADGATWRERYTRLQAELENLRRRWEQRFALETAEARHAILRDMLPLADHLEMALRHGEALEGEQAREFLRNIEATYQAFIETLRRYGVALIAAQGQPFDPNLHEAVGQIHTDAVPAGAVAEVVQTGYTEGDKLLRAARVLVNVE
jgi:molecular chaperone GrpE